MNVRLRLALLGSLMVATSVVRCGGTTQSGSESHFLGECAATSECGQELECRCGVCTSSCTADMDCENLSVAAQCVESAGCETRICDLPCVSDADCGTLGGNLECLGGSCREASNPVDAGNGDGGASPCQGSVEAYCASRSECVTQWPQDENALCDQDGRVLSVAIGCGDRNIARYQGTDTRALYFYDSSTGQLIAISSHTLGTTACVAGPQDFDAALAETTAFRDCSWMTVDCLAAGRPTCVQFCGSDFVAEPIPDGTGWRCPDGFVDAATCPSNSLCGLLPPCCATDGTSVDWTCVDGSAVCPPNTAPGPCSGVCADDAACNDFVFCNGVEVCADGACEAGPPLADGTFCGQDRVCQAGECVAAPSPTEWTTCTDEPCLCDGLAACAPVERRVALPLGSMGSRVCGVQGDQCVISAYDETEGGVTVLRCEVPLGDSCDDGVTLAAGSPYCETMLSCNVLMQSCPADLLACPSVSPPSCSAVDPNAFGDCTLSLGYAFDGTGCVSVSGCGCDPSCDSFYATRNECWAACSRSCTDVVAARQDFYEQNDHCTTDADCMWVESGGPPYEHCSCMVAVNRNIDIGVWRALNLSYGCFEQGTCCDADPPPTPTCNAGRCVAGSG